MIRTILVLLVVVSFGASALHADEVAGPVIDAADWPLLPVNELEGQELARDHPQVVSRLTRLAKRVATLRRHLATRANKQDAGSRKLRTQILATEQETKPLLASALAALKKDVIDPSLLKHIAAAPEGPYRSARYAAGLTLFVDGMPDAPRGLLTHIVPRFQGALLGIHGQRERLRLAAKQADLGSDQRKALEQSLAQQVRTLEVRFWRLVDYIVPEPQRVAIHKRLPSDFQKRESALEHIYALPELTAAQGARIRAVLEEMQAQAAPDTALMKRLQQTGAKTAEQRADMQAAKNRLVDLRRWATDLAKDEILSEAQWLALTAVPPRVTINDRKATSPALLAGTTLTPSQEEQLVAMRAELKGYQREYREKRLKAGARMALLGPDSPQMAGAQMAMAAVESNANVVQRRFNGRVFLELLTPDQVAAWTLGLTGGNR